MVKKSLQTSLEGRKLAKTALIALSFTQQQLADVLEVTRQPISKFFNGKPVDRNLFLRICEKLKLDWQEIAELDEAWDIEQNFTQESDIDALVQEIREKVKPSIKKRCGTMQVLDMTQPIELTGERGIYTNVNILEQITGRRRLAIAELFQNVDPENFERCGLSQVTEKRVPGLEAVQRYDKLMVLGKPGAGKTTFLKYLAMQCIEALFQKNRVPLFITIKDFAEEQKKPSLPDYIAQQFVLCGVDRASDKVEQLLRQGRALILLDGLDEVREEDTNWVLTQICEVADYFQENQFVITCRIAAKEYTFQGFTEVEMADFNKEQIATFAQNWFRSSNPVKIKRFIQKVQNQPIQELATNPLLLTLLCLVFGETGDFPANRSELYQEGIDILLKKWDAKRNIERDQVYKNLSLQRKEDLLSQIALTTFEQKHYFFKQKRVEEYIADFIQNLYREEPDPEALKLDSEVVLKAIEKQHGLLVARANRIYSFSHLTFHEYFTAREIVANNAYTNLGKHITEKRWREVFLLTAGMMRNADELILLMKSHVDQLLANDEKLQQFLKWLFHKSNSLDLPYKLSAIRFFYYKLTDDLDGSHGITWHPVHSFYYTLDLVNIIDNNLTPKILKKPRGLDIPKINTLAPNLIADHALLHLCNLFFIINQDYENIIPREDLSLNPNFSLHYNLSYALIYNSAIKQKLRILKKQLPTPGACKYKFISWWQNNSDLWFKKLRSVMIKDCNLGHDWQFNKRQKNFLQQYYNSNLLLINCLNSDCYVSRHVRQEIEDTLLLPISEIEKRQKEKI